MDMSDVIKYPLSAAIELCEQLDNDETNYRLKMLEYKRERDEARFLLKQAQSSLDAIHLEVGGWIKILKENTD
jgi:hypothetical protein